MNILNEEWRDIVGYEGFYQVSNFGNVRSLDRYVPCKNNSQSLKRGQFLSQKINRYGILALSFLVNPSLGMSPFMC